MAREPLSWLTLERYALGELSAVERAEVEACLAASEEDRACLAQILADSSELPALPGGGSHEVEPRCTSRSPMRWLAWSGGLCAAAAALLLLITREDHTISDYPGTVAHDGVKGSDVALRLVSDRRGPDPRSFSAGERFKLEVTCPPRLSAQLQVWVFQAGEVFEPLPASGFACGNLVPWPGAFSLDGTAAAEVCLSWSTLRVGVKQRTDLGREAVCVTLAPH